MEDIKKIFGENVKIYRLEKELSQEKLAELTGLHRTYISDIERFNRSISLDNIQKIAIALNKDYYELFLNERTIKNEFTLQRYTRRKMD